MIFYNKKAFAKAGLDPDKPELATYDQFLASSRKLVATQAAKFAIYPAPSNEFYQLWFTSTFVRGGDRRQAACRERQSPARIG